jgi:hypothetical protein
VASEAASIGTAAHQAIEDAAMVDGTRVPFCAAPHEPQVITVLDGFEQFERQSGNCAQAQRSRGLVAPPPLCWHHRRGWRATKMATRVALDWKTSNAVRESYALQLAAYVIAWNEMHPTSRFATASWCASTRSALNEAKQLASMQKCQESFLSALQLWRWRAGKLFDTFA